MIVFQSSVIKVNKKKILTRYIGVARIFDSGGEAKPPITRNDVIKFLEEGLFAGQRYRRMEDQKPGPGLAYKLSFAKEKGFEPKL